MLFTDERRLFVEFLIKIARVINRIFRGFLFIKIKGLLVTGLPNYGVKTFIEQLQGNNLIYCFFLIIYLNF